MTSMAKSIINGVDAFCNVMIDGDASNVSNKQAQTVIEHFYNLAPKTFPRLISPSRNFLDGVGTGQSPVMDVVTYMHSASLEMFNLHDRDIPVCLRGMYQNFLR